MGLLGNLLQSNGYKRGLAAALAAAAAVAPYFPVVASYQEMLTKIAGILGAVGLLHAGVSAAKK